MAPLIGIVVIIWLYKKFTTPTVDKLINEKYRYEKYSLGDLVLLDECSVRIDSFGNEFSHYRSSRDSERIIERLELAIKAGEIIRVRYWGGKRAGSIREILPLEVFKPYVLVVTFEKGRKKEKTYFIHRIDIEEEKYEAA